MIDYQQRLDVVLVTGSELVDVRLMLDRMVMRKVGESPYLLSE